MVLMSYYTSSLVYFLFISAYHHSSATPSIKSTLKAFDPAGRETSLLYDGGSVEIICQCNSSCTRPQLSVTDAKGNSDKIAPTTYRNGSNLRQYKISINSSMVRTEYTCGATGAYSFPITIDHILCNPISIKPRKVCHESGSFCLITKHGSAECGRLKKDSCLYHHTIGEVDGEKKNLQVLPGFSAICGTKKKSTSGLLYSLYNSPNQAVRFVTNDIERCNLDFQMYICGKDCKSKEKMMMTGWNFVDVTNPCSICVKFKAKSRKRSHYHIIICDIAYIQNERIKSFKAGILASNRDPTILTSKQLKQLPTPTIADIVCNVKLVKSGDDILLQYQTRILVFKSSKDIRYNITPERVGTNDNSASYMPIINVIAPPGLYVCVVEGKTSCTPRGATNIATIKSAVVYKQVEGDYKIDFYVGLFASSPKQKYVLIYERVVNGLDELVEIDNETGMIKAGKTESGGPKIVLVISLIVAGGVVTAVIVIAALWFRHKKAKQRQPREADKGVSPTKLLPRSISKEAHSTLPSSDLDTNTTDLDKTLPSYYYRSQLDTSKVSPTRNYETVVFSEG